MTQLKKIPHWYLYTVICFLIYGAFSIYWNDTYHGMELLRLAVRNIIITVVFIVFNLVMWFYFVKGNYEREAIVLVSYYIGINVLNAFNIQYRWLDSYEIERIIAMVTKVFEVFFIGRIFWLHRKR